MRSSRLGTRTLPLTIAVWLPLLVPGAGAQEVPTTMNYQGRLTDNTATPAAVDAVLPMTFSIWDSAVGGTSLWSEAWDAPQPQVVVSDGLFDVVLGTHVPIAPSVFASGTARWLQVTIDGEVLAPRQRLSSVGWAFHADSGAGSADLPAGLIAHFDGTSCPPGWTAVSAARGRYLVGLPTGGSLAGVQGTPLTSLEDRPVGQHSHGVTQTPHSHTYVPPTQTSTGSGNSAARVGSAQQTSADLVPISINAAGTVAGTNAPYVQYLVCRKN